MREAVGLERSTTNRIKEMNRRQVGPRMSELHERALCSSLGQCKADEWTPHSSERGDISQTHKHKRNGGELEGNALEKKGRAKQDERNLN